MVHHVYHKAHHKHYHIHDHGHHYYDHNGVEHVYVHHEYPDHHTIIIRDENGHAHYREVYVRRHHHGWIIGCAIVVFILAIVIIIGCAHKKGDTE